MKRYPSLLPGFLLGVLVLLLAGCAVRSPVYPAYPYYYGGYSWYPYSGYYWGPPYYGYYWYPYDGYSRWPYPDYHYRDYHYRAYPRDWNDYRRGRPGPPQEPPPGRRPPLKPPVPKRIDRPPPDRPTPR